MLQAQQKKLTDARQNNQKLSVTNLPSNWFRYTIKWFRWTIMV